MAGKLDFNDCKIVSWGSSTAGSLKGTGLNEAAVRFSPTGCTTLPNLFNVSTSLCFSTISGKNLYCSGDNGAPVYCKAPSNGEWILLGVAAMQLTCNGSNEVKVIPFPG
ncbi:transmembrane protease serine 7-like [Physella acuta]|uniref:transmembrane protease serine 7-like n=1 Tax=Physella acuta TaxID=109671 RepID=UPI0027DC98FA|nr:transmembrane protease serine 7-like [Physella acuta]